MTQKSWKTMGYVIDFKNRSRCVFVSEKGAVSNFFFEKGAVGQKRLGTCVLDDIFVHIALIYLHGLQQPCYPTLSINFHVVNSAN
jgi:hypothetical protein